MEHMKIKQTGQVTAIILALSLSMLTACGKDGTSGVGSNSTSEVDSQNSNGMSSDKGNADANDDNNSGSENAGNSNNENDGNSSDNTGNSSDNTGNSDSANEENSETGNSEEPRAQLTKSLLSSNTDICSFIAGEWTFVNSKDGEEYGTMTFKEDGSCTFTRLEDGASCDGEIKFEKTFEDDKNPNAYTLKLTSLEDFLPKSEDAYVTSEAETSGIFHIGIGKDKDYLYLSEEGNGDTWISLGVFSSYNPDTFDNYQTDWEFVRKNGEHSSDIANQPLENQEFYAFAWAREDNGNILLQKMVPDEFETYEEYTDRAFTAAYFTEDEDLTVSSYEPGDGVQTDKLLYEDRFSATCPLYIYNVKTDSSGKIAEIKEVDDAFYGMYDLGNLEPVIKFEGDTFYYNNSTFKLSEFAPAATAIMDCRRVGDFIVLDCHVNPHYGLYVFYNIYMNDFVYSIMGANLIWQDDDLSTAVYSRYNEIYDFWGNLIGSVQEGEVFGLSFAGDDKVGAECWKIEGEEESTFTEEFEYEPVDHELFSYLRYHFSSKPSRWEAFVSEAPENAAAFVIENGPEEISDLLGPAVFYEDGAQEHITVISIIKSAKVFIEPAVANDVASENDATSENDVISKNDTTSGHNPDNSSDGKHLSEIVEMTKGQKQQFVVSIAEVMANDNLIIESDDGRKAVWPIELISGRVPKRSTFAVFE